MNPSRSSRALVAHSSTFDVASTYSYQGLGSDVHRPTSVGALGWSGPVVVVAAL